MFYETTTVTNDIRFETNTAVIMLYEK